MAGRHKYPIGEVVTVKLLTDQSSAIHENVRVRIVRRATLADYAAQSFVSREALVGIETVATVFHVIEMD